MNKKVLLSCLSIVIIGSLNISILSGAYIENLPIELTLPNGDTIHCYASGDEFFNYAHTEDGYTIIIGEDGYYYYGVREGDLVVPSNYRIGSVNPSQVGIPPRAMISEKAYNEKRKAYAVPLERNDTRAPHEGEMNNLVIYIRFANDSDFTRNVSYYDERFNRMESQSLRDYFLEVSYGKLDIVSHHFPEPAANGAIISYQDNLPRNHFRPYNATSNPDGYQNETERRDREHSLLVRTIRGVRDLIPEEIVIDGDNDGRVDNVCFIIRGNADAWADLLWAHRWSLYSQEVTIHGKRVYDYTFQPENQATASTLSHEMFHTLGAPDLYRYSQDGYNPVGPWDLMSSGFVHMGAWMKYKYADRNWIANIPEITSVGDYSLHPITSETNNAYLIRSAYSERQFFVVEYRRKVGRYESSIPGSGLLVYRINSAKDGNAEGPPDEVYIFRPNGTTTDNGEVRQAFYNSTVGRTEINDFDTNPVSFLSNGSPGGLQIYNIGAAGDSITFSVDMVGDLIAPIMIMPPSSSEEVGVTPRFEWGYINVADRYNLQVSLDSLFTDLVFDERDILELHYQVEENMDVEQTYYWRVSSSKEEEMSDWSDPWKFTIAHFTKLPPDTIGVAYGGLAWGDLDKDGFLDLVITGEDRTFVYHNQGDGSFKLLDPYLPQLKRSSVALGDINNNGYLDIILIGRSTDNLPKAYVCLSDGSMNFAVLDGGLEGASNGSIALGDYDNDGLIDILIVGDSLEGPSARLYKNQGDNFFQKVETEGLPGLVYGDVAWADFNNDGKLDILMSGSSSEGAFSEIFFNNGDGTFSKADAGLIKVSGSSVDVGDFDNDGYIDIVIGGNTSSGPSTTIYRNNGDGSFSETNYEVSGTALGDVRWGDLDNDGYLDLLITGSNKSQVFRNLFGLYFSKVISGTHGVSFSSAGWGDYDNDGDLDIAIIGSGAGGLVLNIYRNNAGSNNAVINTPPTTPENPQSSVENGSVTLSWDMSEDSQTPSEGITYNLSVGTRSGAEDYLSSMSSLTTGYRRLPARGNVGPLTSVTISNLPIGEYFWRVQAVDGSFAGSPFTSEDSFSICVTSTDDNEPVTPMVTELHSNYPNPFNPKTNIRFSLAVREKVTLEVYNIIGQKVATLVDEELDAGQHVIEWDADNDKGNSFSSGIYFYRLQTNSYSSIKKMLLLK